MTAILDQSVRYLYYTVKFTIQDVSRARPGPPIERIGAPGIGPERRHGLPPFGNVRNVLTSAANM